VKKPKMPKAAEPQQITPMPDISSAQTQQAKYDALKRLTAMRGRSATLMTYNRRRLGDGQLSGRLSDLPENARVGTDIVRGS
jgi:hypothetical protein